MNLYHWPNLLRDYLFIYILDKWKTTTVYVSQKINHRISCITQGLCCCSFFVFLGTTFCYIFIISNINLFVSILIGSAFFVWKWTMDISWATYKSVYMYRWQVLPDGLFWSLLFPFDVNCLSFVCVCVVEIYNATFRNHFQFHTHIYVSSSDKMVTKCGVTLGVVSYW